MHARTRAKRVWENPARRLEFSQRSTLTQRLDFRSTSSSKRLNTTSELERLKQTDGDGGEVLNRQAGFFFPRGLEQLK